MYATHSVKHRSTISGPGETPSPPVDPPLRDYRILCADRLVSVAGLRVGGWAFRSVGAASSDADPAVTDASGLVPRLSGLDETVSAFAMAN
jgi:hypothetical protein